MSSGAGLDLPAMRSARSKSLERSRHRASGVASRWQPDRAAKAFHVSKFTASMGLRWKTATQ
eukprot:6754064-Pyramimonas_sp.AAC.1